MGVLPKGYQVPQGSGNYMKFKIGENKFRVLGEAIVGMEGWKTKDDGKRSPVRKAMVEDEKPAFSLSDIDDPEQIKSFMAFPVWNYVDKKVQILELTQKGIMKNIVMLENNDDWGDLRNFDLLVGRVGEGMETEYTIQPAPPKPLSEDIEKAWKVVELNFDIKKLFTNQDPFGTD